MTKETLICSRSQTTPNPRSGTMDRSRIPCSDRLSDLPCNLIEQILTLLTLKEAVRTSTLSKKWKCKWVSIPQLVFDNPDTVQVVYHVLKQHRGPIIKFSIQHALIGQYTSIDDWLAFLSDHKIEDLTIKRTNTYETLLFSHHLFTLHHLRYLYLERFEVVVPLLASHSFNSLVKLHLEHVTFNPLVLEEFISMCPVLEFFSLSTANIIGFPAIRFQTPPNLKCFRFHGGVFKYLLISESSRLEEISIQYTDDPLFWYASDYVPWIDYDKSMEESYLGGSDYLTQLFHKVSSIKKLEVDSRFLQFLGEDLDEDSDSDVVPQKLPENLDHLKVIQFSGINFQNVFNVACALCLIRSSPNLESFVIGRGTYQGNGEFEVLEYLKAQVESEIPLSCGLKDVTIEYMLGLAPELKFLKLLLSGAPELRTVKIAKCHFLEETEVVKQIGGFRRASTEVVLVFY